MLSAVIPTLNEAATLPGLLAALRPEVDEIIVADADSPDGTARIAAAEGVVVVRSDRGRGRQLNAGAAAARGDLLWFIHADSTLPRGVGAALRTAPTEWGCFATRVGSEDPRLRFTGRWMTRRARRVGSCTGDMGIWATRHLFSRLTGFAEAPCYEDLDFSDRARRLARWSVLTPAIVTSARRWEQQGASVAIASLWYARIGYHLRTTGRRCS